MTIVDTDVHSHVEPNRTRNTRYRQDQGWRNIALVLEGNPRMCLV